MSAFSVSSLLNNNDRSRSNRPAVLDISNLLCEEDVCPSLSSPESAPSSGSCSPLNGYPLPPIWTLKSDDRMVMSWTNDSSSSLSSIGSSSTHEMSSPITPTNNSTRKLPLKKQRHLPSTNDTSSVISSSHSISSHSSSYGSDDEQVLGELPLKAKRRRANAKQLEVLNRVFDRTVFPSTQLRAELGRQLGMSPRTVQIWFQNRRQAIRTRERQRLLRIVRDESSSTD
ncbi:hypothetical protein INT45_012779 [Circinella minor]|uniref:Homeobox domain-containing protein n=1 Tax=Circinella minor TaxID=1195481 RepID=A0A8H7RVL9_9FUNG|nr:hypothetical protein INT45_012779 [Circinella minor]